MGDSKRRTSSVVLLLLLLLLLLNLYSAMFFLHCSAQTLPQDEVESLKMIASKLNITYWKVTETSCTDGSFNSFTTMPGKILNNVTCDCTFNTSKTCHVTNIQLKGLNLTGTLPTEFANLTQLTEIDLTRNYINGTLLTNLARIPLKILGLIGNRISGTIPKEFAEITTLESLVLEDNQLSGPLDPSLGTLSNLTRLLLSANNFNGTIPESFGSLKKLTDFRIDGSPVTGKLPEFIGNWTNITRLDMQGTAMEGPIPSAISNLTKLLELRITDLNGSTTSPFPNFKALKSLKQLVLRNCLITGEIQDFGDITSLQMLDLSFNRLTGPVPDALQELSGLNFMILTNNSLTGSVPNWALNTKQNFDYSYNNFTGSSTATCQQSSVNFISSYSSSQINSVSQWCLKKDLPCSKKPQHHSLFINCGGEAVKIGENQYTEDTSSVGGATFVASSDQRWAHSTTGQYMNNDKALYKATNQFSLDIDGSDAELYQTARLAPISLKYYGLCMIPGSYTVKLHFAEIMYSDAQDFASLGERIFDVSIQGELMLKDYNIAEKAGGVGKPRVEPFKNVTVTGTTLEIHLYWSGKGTTAIPDRGVYGPLISAISITPNFKIPGGGLSTGAIVGIAVAVSCVVLLLLVLAILWYIGFLQRKDEEENELRHLDLQTGRFSLRQIKAATGNFAPENKIGEGGFGPVFKGVLADGTVMAVKQLSSKSKQGNREFLNEIGMISAVQHPNLVKLYGCCIEGKQLLLIYEYLENNSLARALFGREEQRLQLDWATRKRICIQIAKGLTYLHEESPLKIVHRDIKATNVLLDKDLTAKISDFGLAKLDEEENTHISTRIAGTVGYMAPEYAMRGYLTEKADIYSFGVVILEIVSGKSNTNYRPKEEFVYLLDWAYVLQEQGNLLELVDPSLGKKFSKHEAMRMLNLALLCTNPSPTLRPPMSSVVAMLEGKGPIQAPIVQRDPDNPEARFRAFEIISQDSGTNYSLTSPETELVHQRTGSMDGPWIDSTDSLHSKYESEGHSSEKRLLPL